MADTFVKIATVTVGAGGAANIDFTSIPSTYTDLLLACSLRSTTTDQDPKMEFNGVTTGYSRRTINGSGTVAASSSASDAWIGTIDSTSNTASTFANTQIYIPNYTSANYKSYSIDAVMENNATQAFQTFNGSLWSNTAAITSIKFSALSGSLTFAQYSTATLYGILKA
jgi:hypothetical protein